VSRLDCPGSDDDTKGYIKLTDTQIVLLSAAAQRDDRCLLAPRNLKGGAAQKVAAKLVDGGLAKEIKAKPGAPVWRQDEQAGISFALKLTAAGARAIAIYGSSASAAMREGSGGRVRVAAYADPGGGEPSAHPYGHPQQRRGARRMTIRGAADFATLEMHERSTDGTLLNAGWDCWGGDFIARSHLSERGIDFSSVKIVASISD
jgi:hypothetical protein